MSRTKREQYDRQKKHPGKIRCMAHRNREDSICRGLCTKVVDTGGNEHRTVVFRKRKCPECGFYFHTREEIDMTGRFGYDEIKR